MTRQIIHIPRESFRHPDIDGLVLYRCYGLDGTLMYIGQTRNLRNRIKNHRESWWFAVERIEVQQYRSYKVLRQDELRAIHFEQPHFNKQGKSWTSVPGLAGRFGKKMWGGDTGFVPPEHAENCTCLHCHLEAVTMVVRQGCLKNTSGA